MMTVSAQQRHINNPEKTVNEDWLRMKRIFQGIVLLLFLMPAYADDEKDAMCAPVEEFLKTIEPDTVRRIDFHTSWGGNFDDSTEPALSAKRCNHYGYGPARVLCATLIKHSSTESAGRNLKRLVMCLSPRSKFDPHLSFASATVSTTYGTADRGSIVDIEFRKDTQIGGMVLGITARGY
ncbi:MAG: hypothetical protein V4723_04300 [Pseudomonadota bacterium]